MDELMDWSEEKLLDLDNDKTYKIDEGNSYDWIYNWPELLANGINRFLGEEFVPDVDAGSITGVYICGMGGSAIAGEILGSLLRNHLEIPVSVIRDYTLPSTVNEKSLVIGISYSGNTEETISAINGAVGKNAKILGVTTGGELEDILNTSGFEIIKLRSDYPAPRLALPELLTALFSIFYKCFEGWKLENASVARSIEVLNENRESLSLNTPTKNNPAKQLAIKLHSGFPILLGTDVIRPVLLRFQAQLNENSKWPAHVAVIPEFDHNEIVAFSHDGPATGMSGLLVIYDDDDHPRNARRLEYTVDLIKPKMKWMQGIRDHEKNYLARMLSLIQVADFATYYLACARGIDPMDISAIEDLKLKLKND
jgi:glucose/mannose-6-phosphate isomerase